MYTSTLIQNRYLGNINWKPCNSLHWKYNGIVYHLGIRSIPIHGHIIGLICQFMFDYSWFYQSMFDHNWSLHFKAKPMLWSKVLQQYSTSFQNAKLYKALFTIGKSWKILSFVLVVVVQIIWLKPIMVALNITTIDFLDFKQSKA